MRRILLAQTLACVLTLATPCTVFAENGSYTGAGGSFSTGTAVGQNISVQGVPLTGLSATASLTCPITFYGAGTYQLTWSCSGGSMAIASTDSSITLNGSFLSGSMTFTGSGGGRGGHVTYWYQFFGTFTGTVTRNGLSQGINGSISTAVKTTKQIGTGSAAVTSLSSGWSSEYSSVIVGDSINSRLLEADSLGGANLATYGGYGTGVGEFEAIAGLAQDAGGRIYISDSTSNRIDRIDDLTGLNWTTLGSTGSGASQFNHPLGVAIDSAGKIWVADSGNNRIVRFDDMTGAHWTAFGSAGSGANQFSSPSAVAFDSAGRIYVADSGNNRLVRLDNLTGANWTTLTTINIGVYGHLLTGVNSVAVLPSGKIFATTPGGMLYRVDDMTGAKGEASSWSPSIAGISLDGSGTLFVAGGFTPGLATTLDAYGTGIFTGNLGQNPLQPSAVLALASSSPPPAVPLLSTTALDFASQNVGEPGPAQIVTITNLGGQPLSINSVTASPDFLLSNGCSAPVAGGSSCTVGVQLDPAATGPRSANLSVASNSVHPLLQVALTGTGTAPKAVVVPGGLVFPAQLLGTSSGAASATLTNTGSGPLTIASIMASGDFTQTNNCPAVVAPGGGCTIAVVFTAHGAGTRTGHLTISDDAIPAGTTQVVILSGTGAATAPLLTLTPSSLYFPNQQVGVASSAQTLTLKNGSTAKIALTAPVYPGGFKGTTTCGTSLAAGASCTLKVTFAPPTAGPRSGTLTVPITGQTALTAGLAGTGVVGAQPALTFSPGTVEFGALVVGDNPSQNLVITNSSGLPTGISSIALSGSSAFTKGGSCPAILAGGASCTITITFIPTAVATYAGTITVKESSGAKSLIALTGSASLDNGN